MASPIPLPLQIIRDIALALDESRDRSTLAALRLVSRDSYFIATDLLYRDILISDRGQNGLLEIELTWKKILNGPDGPLDQGDPVLTFQGKRVDKVFWEEFGRDVDEWKDEGSFLLAEHSSARQLHHLRLARRIRIMAVPDTPAWQPHVDEDFHNSVMDDELSDIVAPDRWGAIYDTLAATQMREKLANCQLLPNLERLVLGRELLSTILPAPDEASGIDIHTSKGLWSYLIHFFVSPSTSHVCFDFSDTSGIQSQADGDTDHPTFGHMTGPDEYWLYRRLLWQKDSEIASVTVHHARLNDRMPLPFQDHGMMTYQVDVPLESKRVSQIPHNPIHAGTHRRVVDAIGECGVLEEFELHYRYYNGEHRDQGVGAGTQHSAPDMDERQSHTTNYEGALRGALGRLGADGNIQERVQMYHHFNQEPSSARCECCDGEILFRYSDTETDRAPLNEFSAEFPPVPHSPMLSWQTGDDLSEGDGRSTGGPGTKMKQGCFWQCRYNWTVYWKILSPGLRVNVSLI